MQGITSNVLKEIIDKQEECNAELQLIKKTLAANLNQKNVKPTTWSDDKLKDMVDRVKGISVESLGGKKWASGYIQSVQDFKTIEIRGLDFNVDTIIWFYEDYRTGVSDTLNYGFYSKSLHPEHKLYVTMGGSKIIKIDSNDDIGTNYIKLYGVAASKYVPIKWIAFGS